ncbi:tRNA (adenosine(37)-N6)-threonylcarbamoyltransferase complex dimerization subunit type 1 TsaB [Methylotetracoccus oryzae]|uniref:tRNA (adenosine(37)-N6)-threonylcarbamoyltransferase complex dimerization subunit type 1 TsaB n=1 Tax=Methylotetracoccus oryzae TaxID=1919059 RepID=UPI001119D47B|nr:tRNA (adenosine(37)-N6)-threonylcarbamoyltransferase complex dimerization subunit type 1 TsaB [Methylotetracoccus oryzae]
MKILAIETATEACSAALVQDGDVIERYVVAPREHNRLILPMIEEVLAEAGVVRTQIDAVAFGRGPGSFTGLRIAAGVTQGIAYGLDCPVLPVSTLAALAFQSFEEAAGEGVYACLDARMGEIYGALFRRGQAGVPDLIGDEAVLAPERVEAAGIMVRLGVGSGWVTYRGVLSERLKTVVEVLEDHFPRAAYIGRLGARDFAAGRCVSAGEAIPVYLRDQVARKPRTQARE